MTLETWGVFAITEIALCLTPGPAVLFVVSQGLRYGGSRSILANVGILCGNAFYFALSAFGLGTLLLASHRLFLVIKWVGAAYLVFLGVRTFFERRAISGANEDGSELSISGPGMLARGFATQVANPKALVFFAAFLPQFIQPNQAVLPQLLILGITSEMIEFIVLGGYGMLSASAASMTRRPRFATITNRVSGGLLIAAGAGIALARIGIELD